MKALLQRVTHGSVRVGDEIVGDIGAGLVILVGVGHDDTEKDADFLAEKAANLRIFEDEEGKMNLSLLDTGGGALAISQFTLYADARRGRRPSFTDAAAPGKATALYERFAARLRELGVPTQTGVFGAKMLVSILNDGPVTILLSTGESA